MAGAIYPFKCLWKLDSLGVKSWCFVLCPIKKEKKMSVSSLFKITCRVVLTILY